MNQQSTFGGAILIILGVLFLMRELFDWFNFNRYGWPIMLIAIGVLLIFKDKFKRLP